jgi:dihydrofolate reductase
MIISIVAALAQDRVIGYQGELPWGRSLPADRRRFRNLTLGKIVIMGRKTFENILKVNGKPLTNRINVILTKRADYVVPSGCFVVSSIEEALERVRQSQEIFVIGGASVYEQFLGITERMYLTLIHHHFPGDAFFPEYNLNEWQVVSRRDYPADQDNLFPFSFLDLRRYKERCG